MYPGVSGSPVVVGAGSAAIRGGVAASSARAGQGHKQVCRSVDRTCWTSQRVTGDGTEPGHIA